MSSPNFFFEKKLWKKGIKYVVGMDEVGRGCFAGSVVVGCVCFSKGIIIPKDIYINDSKKVTKKRREIASVWIKENVETWGMGEASVSEINRLGMGKATKVAFRRAVGNANKRLHKRIQYLLIDAFYIPYLRGFPIYKNSSKKGYQMPIVNGDEKSISIAAASIIAKVYRDEIMERIGNRKIYKKYDWINNKGYATKKHQKAILRYGTVKHHRRQFINTFLEKRKG